MKLTRFWKIRRDQLTQVTLYNRIAKGIRAERRKNRAGWRIEEKRKIEKVGKAVVSETSTGGKEGFAVYAGRGSERHPGSHSKQTRWTGFIIFSL